MKALILSIPIVFILGLIVGFFIGKKRAFKGEILPALEKHIDKKLKVFHKAQPKTYKERQAEAVDKGKPIIKVFRK